MYCHFWFIFGIVLTHCLFLLMSGIIYSPPHAFQESMPNIILKHVHCEEVFLKDWHSMVLLPCLVCVRSSCSLCAFVIGSAPVLSDWENTLY